MAKVQISDYALWVKHICGDDRLRDHLDALRPNDTVTLRVNGLRGVWRKMSANRTTGQATPGLSPLGGMQQSWAALFRERKGELVDIALVQENGIPSSSTQASPTDREAAWAAFKAVITAGWRSEGAYGPRDELHERPGA